MKLGTENRTKVILASVLGVIAVFTMARMFWPSAQSAAPIAPSAQPIAGLPQRPAPRRTASGKAIRLVEPRLDPTLDLDLLRKSEEIKYAGNGRNIFIPGSEPVIPRPIKNPALDQQVHLPPPTPPLPPIDLKFFGFANKPGEAKRVFLQHGEDVFIASEGDIVNRRYRVLHIAPNSVDIEDVINSNRQSIPLTQG